MTSNSASTSRIIEVSSNYRTLTVAYFLIAFAIFISHGHYSWIALVFVLLALVAIPVGALFRRNREADVSSSAAPQATPADVLALHSDSWAPAWRPLAYGLLFFIALGFLKEPGIYYRRDLGNFFLTVHLFALILAMAYCIPRVHRVVEWGRLPALIAAVIILRVAMILASPTPTIDVWYHLQEGTDAIWKGLNPYSQTYTNPYQAGVRAAGQSYMPAILFSLAPFRLIGDVRYGLACFDVLTALLLINTFKHLHDKPADRPWAELWALLYLFFPRAIFVTEQSWNEPVLIFYLALWLNLYVRKRLVAAAVVFGIFLSTKQYLIFLAPMWILFIERNPKRIAIAVGAAAVLPLYFLLLNPAGLLWSSKDMLGYLASRTDGLDALTVNAFMMRNHQTNLPGAIGIIIGVASTAVCYVKKRRRAPLAAFFETAFFTYLAMFVMARRAYCNYYYFIEALPVGLAIVLSAERLSLLNGPTKVSETDAASPEKPVGATLDAIVPKEAST